MAKKSLAFRRKKFSELTDSQWQCIEDLDDAAQRKRKNSLRLVLNAIMKVNSTGMQWRELDEKYPPWQSVYYYFRKWQKDGTFRLILRRLRQMVRVQMGRQAEPSMAAVDSQSVKKGPLVSQETGIDGVKNINGRKRDLAVDSIGLPLAVHVTAANLNDGMAGFDLLWQMDEESKRLSLVRADHAYQGEFQVAAAYLVTSVCSLINNNGNGINLQRVRSLSDEINDRIQPPEGGRDDEVDPREPDLSAEEQIRRRILGQVQNLEIPKIEKTSKGEGIMGSLLDMLREMKSAEQGPADVTALRDFHSLQIAIPHVWAEAFDGRLRSNVEQLYRETVRLHEDYGVEMPVLENLREVNDFRGFLSETGGGRYFTIRPVPGEGTVFFLN